MGRMVDFEIHFFEKYLKTPYRLIKSSHLHSHVFYEYEMKL